MLRNAALAVSLVFAAGPALAGSVLTVSSNSGRNVSHTYTGASAHAGGSLSGSVTNTGGNGSSVSNISTGQTGVVSQKNNGRGTQQVNSSVSISNQ